MLGKLAKSIDEAKEKLQTVLDNGKVAEVFAKMVTALGGPSDFMEKYDDYLDKAEIIRPVYADKSGVLQSMDTRAIGMAVVAMGGGRRKPSDNIDYAVGFSDFVAIGGYIDESTPLAMVHVRTETQFKEAQEALREAIVIGNETPETKVMVFEKIRLEDV